jgi:dTDP-glucose 4,6-dehydratase/UDP-glucose 4-epimerase
MRDYANKKVLITGGLGFIGSHLARALVQWGAQVTVVDSLIPQYGGNLFNVQDIRQNLRVNISDVRDPFSLRHLVQDQDVLFNLAGQTSHLDSMTDPFVDLKINAEAQLSILQVCREVNPSVRIVFASTRQLYGRPRYLPVDEKHPIDPVDINGIHKLAGEMYHTLFAQVYQMRSSVLRLTNTYGPGMRIQDARQTFVGIWIRNLLEGKPIKIYGDGLQRRDFNYVSDVVDAFLTIAQHEETVGQIYNLGGKETIDLSALADLMISLHGTGQKEYIPFPPERKAIDIGDYYSDFSKLQSTIAWEPQVALHEGMGKTLDYFREYARHYLREVES